MVYLYAFLTSKIRCTSVASLKCSNAVHVLHVQNCNKVLYANFANVLSIY